MKKTILNIAAITVIATTSFIACDKKASTDAAPAADSLAIDSTAQEAPVAPATDSVAAPATDSVKADAAAPAAETAPAEAK